LSHFRGILSEKLKAFPSILIARVIFPFDVKLDLVVCFRDLVAVDPFDLVLLVVALLATTVPRLLLQLLLLVLATHC